MLLARRSFIYVLLLSLFLHLGDWPYMDEVMGEPGPVTQLIEAALPCVVSGAPAQGDGSVGTSAEGYQLLLSMQGIPVEPFRLPAPISLAAFGPAIHSFPSLIPPRIDRPPALSIAS